MRYHGFWFPLVQWIINLLYFFSLGRLANSYLERKSLGGPWVSEAYQLLGVLIGFCWMALVEQPVLTSKIWIVIGLIVAFYRVFEILLFSLHWLLVAEVPVVSYRRSLAGFLLNLVEIGIFFTIAYIILGWLDPSQSAWAALLESLRSIFTLKKVSGLPDEQLPQAVAWLQYVISWILVVLIVANVVGSIGRGGRKPTRS
jgi:hypothetical protein